MLQKLLQSLQEQKDAFSHIKMKQNQPTNQQIKIIPDRFQ